MAKERGNIERCISKTRHHVTPHKAKLMAAAGVLTLGQVAYRFKLVDDNLCEAEKKLREIREAAEKGDCVAVLKAMNDQIEFGHDL